MRSLVLGLVAVPLGAAAAQAQGGPATVGEILPGCEAYLGDSPPEDPWLIVLSGECVGSILGVGAVMAFNCDTLLAGTATPHAAVRAARAATREEAVQAWLDWARAHPDQAGAEFIPTIGLAFQASFPCKG